MNGLELKWVGEGDALRLNLSVPGVSALYPVADIIAALKANPEACAEVRTALDPYAYAVRDDAIARAESAERERDALKAKLAEAERSFAGYNAKLHAEALRENDVLRSRASAAEAVVEAARNNQPAFPAATASEYQWKLALRAYDAHKTSAGSGDSQTSEPPVPDMPAQAGEQSARGDTTSGDTRASEPAGDSEPFRVDYMQLRVKGGEGCACRCHDRDPQAPATLADLSALEERIVERVLFALNTTHGFASYAQANHERFDLVDALYSLADELRRKV